MIGSVVGKYRIVGQLGRGAMGTVYRAVDETLYREVAIKVLNPDLVDTPIMKRFRSEATVLARLNHPVIATIYELFTLGDDTLIVMELVPGETLERICTRMGAMAPAHAAHILDRILSALDHAHRAGIVHCDIKPANVMVTAQGDVKIMDFGTARVPGKQQTTADKYMMGTPAYMPPEQVTGQSIDARSDLYAVGVVLYRMLSGTVPFTAESLIGVMQKQISEDAAPLAAHRSGLPDWCEPIVSRAMAKTPADRFQSAAEFSAALRASGAVMRQPVGVAHPDPVTTAAAVERRGELVEEPTLHMSQTLGASQGPATLKGSTVAMPPPVFAKPDAGTATTEPSTPKRDWRPLVATAGTIVVAGLVIWRFGGASLQTGGAAAPTTPKPPAVAPLPAPERPAEASPRPSSRGDAVGDRGTASKSSIGAAGRGNALPPQKGQPPIASAAPPTATARGAAPTSPEGAPAPKTFTPAVFEARYLTRTGDGARERDSRVVLADGKVHVQASEDASTLATVPYGDVLSINYSHGRDPLWNAPGGPEPVARAGGGAFGIFRGPRYWIALRTTSAKNRFVVLRMGNEAVAKRAIAALEERTGRHAQVAGNADTK